MCGCQRKVWSCKCEKFIAGREKVNTLYNCKPYCKETNAGLKHKRDSAMYRNTSRNVWRQTVCWYRQTDRANARSMNVRWRLSRLTVTGICGFLWTTTLPANITAFNIRILSLRQHYVRQGRAHIFDNILNMSPSTLPLWHVRIASFFHRLSFLIDYVVGVSCRIFETARSYDGKWPNICPGLITERYTLYIYIFVIACHSANVKVKLIIHCSRSSIGKETS